MKKIPLTRGMFAMVDDEDYEELSKYKWCVHNDKCTLYAKRAVSINGKHKTIVLHKAILGEIPNGYVIDHIDGNGLNNQRSNLRIVTMRQNMQNLHKTKSSIYPGVSWNKQTNKWRAIIGSSGQRSYHDAEIDAFRAYYDYILSLGEDVLGFDYPSLGLVVSE